MNIIFLFKNRNNIMITLKYNDYIEMIGKFHRYMVSTNWIQYDINYAIYYFFFFFFMKKFIIYFSIGPVIKYALIA